MQGKILVDQVGPDAGIAVDEGRASTTDEMIAGDVNNISKREENQTFLVIFNHYEKFPKLLLNTGCVDETLVS